MFKLELGFSAERFNQEIEFLHYLEKSHMTLCLKSRDLQIENGFKISKLIKKYFGNEKKLRYLGWCANHTLKHKKDKEVSFIFENYSPNRKISNHKIINFDICEYTYCEVFF